MVVLELTETLCAIEDALYKTIDPIEYEDYTVYIDQPDRDSTVTQSILDYIQDRLRDRFILYKGVAKPLNTTRSTVDTSTKLKTTAPIYSTPTTSEGEATWESTWESIGTDLDTAWNSIISPWQSDNILDTLASLTSSAVQSWVQGTRDMIASAAKTEVHRLAAATIQQLDLSPSSERTENVNTENVNTGIKESKTEVKNHNWVVQPEPKIKPIAEGLWTVAGLPNLFSTMDPTMSLESIITTPLFEAFHYFAYFTNSEGEPFGYLTESSDYPFIFFVDKIKATVAEQGNPVTIPYSLFDVVTLMESSGTYKTTLEYNILGDEVLTMREYIRSHALGISGSVQEEEPWSMHIIVPYVQQYEQLGRYVWHFTFSQCKFASVDKIRFDNKKIQPTINKVQMVYKDCWLKSERVS